MSANTNTDELDFFTNRYGELDPTSSVALSAGDQQISDSLHGSTDSIPKEADNVVERFNVLSTLIN